MPLDPKNTSTVQEHSVHRHTVHQHPVDSLATAETSPALKTGSLIALAVTVLGSLWASLALNPVAAPTIADDAEPIEVVDSETINSETIETSETLETTDPTPEATLTPNSTDVDIDVENVEIEDAETETSATEASESATADSIADVESYDVDEVADSSAEETTAVQNTADRAADQAAEGASAVQSTASNVADTAADEVSEGTAAVQNAAEDTATDATALAGSVVNPTRDESTIANDTEATESAAEIASSQETEDVAVNSTTDATSTETTAPGADTAQLQQKVYDTIDQEWTKKNTPMTADSVYVISVTPDGAITSVDPASPTAESNLSNTPFPELRKTGAAATEAAAKFEVRFTENGLLEMKPVQ
ncbi:MAG: hypothetical protein ACFBSC_19450 [Microcoleaceae cyanobacterium]